MPLPSDEQCIPATTDLPPPSNTLLNPNAAPHGSPDPRAEKSRRWFNSTRNPSERLWTAAVNAENEDLKKYLRAGSNVNYCKKVSRPLDVGIGVRSVADIIAFGNNVKAMRVLFEYKVDLSGALTAAEWQETQSSVPLQDRNPSPDSAWTTPLHEACRGGHKDMVEVLLAEGRADHNAMDSKNWTALMLVAKAGHRDIAKLLCSRGATLAFTGNGDQSPLSIAISHGQPDMVRLLMEHGARLDTLHPAGENAFFNAARGNRAVIPILLAHGADINSSGRQSEAAFLLAAGEFDTDAMASLVHYGANVDIWDVNGCAALHRAAMAMNLPLVKHLLHLGADIDVQDKDLWTPLLIAMIQDNHDMVTTLLTNGADMGKTDASGDTALHHAAKLGSTAVVRYLLVGSSGTQVDPSGMNLAGETPLMLASKYGHSAVVKLLLKHGADPDHADPDGYTALDHAVYWGQYACVTHLLRDRLKIHDRLPLLLYKGKQQDRSRTDGYDMISALLQNPGVSCIQWSEKPMSPTLTTPTRSASINSLRARLHEKRVTPVTMAKDGSKSLHGPFESPFPQTAGQSEADDTRRNNSELVLEAASMAVDTANTITTILGS